MHDNIPKILFTYYHNKNEMAENMKKNWEDWKTAHPDFECLLFDSHDANKFLRTYFDEEINECFHILKPQSFKSDLFRYAYMYFRGGIYLDIKYKCIDGFTFHSLYKTQQDYFVKERLGIQTCLMISRPKNPIFLYTLNKIKENCRQRTYGNHQDNFISCLSITGPVLLSYIYFTYFLGIPKYTEVFQETPLVILDENSMVKHEKETLYYNRICHKDLEWKDRDNHKIFWKNKLILQQYETYRRDLLYKNKEPRHYSQMFDEKDIYEERI
jgi:mannosyltransferase OCH1-like enzyme